MLRCEWKAVVRTVATVMLVTVALCIGTTVRAQIDDQRPKLLLIAESDSRLPVAKLLLAGIEAELGLEFTTRSEIYIEYLDMLRFNDPAEMALNRSFLVQRYKGLGVDAVGVLGSNALAFVLDSRDDIAPGAPVVFGGIGEAGLKTALAGRTPTNLSGVISPLDFGSTLDLALKVQPDAPEIVVIAGSANFDRQWRTAFLASVTGTYQGVPVRVLPEATADDYLATARSLDPDAIVLLLSVNLDAAGQRFLPIQFAEALAEASAAPVWSLYETQIGKGIVGGTVEDLVATGAEIGKMMRGAVEGSPLPAPVRATAIPTVDWRVMQRLRLDLGRLPEDSRVLFYEPTLWEQHRVVILAIAAIFAAQTATIIGLIFQRRRYFRTQASLESERSQLIHVSRNLRLGQLSASLAHEINQPLAAILANAEAGTRFLARTPPDLEQVALILQDIAADDRRAADIIADLRRLMIKNETQFELIDLNRIVTMILALTRNEFVSRGTRVETELAPGPLMVNGNPSQLQQIVLNLAMNAAEAMEDLPPAERVLAITTRPLANGGAALAVLDHGPGVRPEDREDLYRPFVTSKPTGLGMGLAICRNIAAAHGGTLAFVDAVQSGTGRSGAGRSGAGRSGAGPSGAVIELALPGPG